MVDVKRTARALLLRCGANRSIIENIFYYAKRERVKTEGSKVFGNNIGRS